MVGALHGEGIIDPGSLDMDECESTLAVDQVLKSRKGQ
jgi:hypothetical protein